MTGSLFWAEVFAHYFFGLKVLLALVALLIFLSSLDDFFIDIYFLVRSAYRRWIVMSQHQSMRRQDLDRPPQSLAILLPAWQESAVIGAMLRHLTRTLDYDDYKVFVGVYPNDSATIDAVRAVAEMSDRVEITMNARDGPTNKGDCLNNIFRHIQEEERRTGREYAIFVLHDAEDIVHPLEAKLFNRLIPRKDMVQLPVMPLEARLTELTAGHYMDEFAEHHTKDLAVREALTGAVPSAGVGCAFSRDAFATLAPIRGGELFNSASLTEDYEIALTLQAMGRKLIFVRFFVEHVVERPRLWGSGTKYVLAKELVGTREYFPKDLHRAYYQKSRWLIGIAFQGWREFGWHGPWMVKYAFFRDRKAIATAQINILAYIVAASIITLVMIRWAGPDAFHFPRLVEQGSWLYYMLIANAFFLTNRIVHRAVYVWRLYGPLHAMMSPIRLVWGNFINFFASCRAMWLFSRSLVSGKSIAWEKTHHHFPDPQDLAPHIQRIGELLVAKRLIDRRALAEALEKQRRDPQPLGHLLIDSGRTTEADILMAVAQQRAMSVRPTLPPEVAATVRERIPPRLQDQYTSVPIGVEDGTLLIASPRLLAVEEIRALSAAAGQPVRQVLSPREEVLRLMLVDVESVK